MITRRRLLMGLAGGVAAATAAATLVRAAPKALGWPFRNGLTQADLPRPHANIKTPVSTPRYTFTQDKDTGIYMKGRDPGEISLVVGGCPQWPMGRAG